MGRQALQPTATRIEPAGQRGDPNSDHKKRQRFNHQTLKNGPNGLEFFNAHRSSAYRAHGNLSKSVVERSSDRNTSKLWPRAKEGAGG